MPTSNTSRTILPPAIAIAGDTLYAGSGSIYALDARSGSLRAKLSGLGRAFTIGEGVLIAAQHPENGAVKATALRDGSLLWRYELGGRPSGPPIIAGGAVYLGVVEGAVLELALADGAQRWRFDCGPIVSASPTVADGVLYAAPAVNAPDVPHVLALDAATGASRWRAPLPASSTVPLTVAGDCLVASTHTGCAALSLADGAPRWSYPLDAGIHASALVPHDGAVFLACTEWRREVADGRPPISRDDAYLLALDAADGALRWRRRVGADTGASHLTAPVIANGVVYVGADDGCLYALEVATGNLRWRYKTGGTRLSTPVIAGDRLYAGANDGYVYALDPTAPTLVWCAFTDTSLAVVSRITISGGLHITPRSPDDPQPE